MERNRTLASIVKRPATSKKYDYGHLLILGGSKHYAGAPILNALGAYIAGVDLVTIAAPARVADIAVAHSPDIIAYPLPGDILTKEHYAEISSLIKRNVTAILIGSGMGRDKSTLDLVAHLHKEHQDIPFVIDADALYSFNLIDPRPHDVLLPNQKEFALISGNDTPTQSTVKSAAFSFGCVILAKGHIDYISDGKSVKEVKDATGKSVYLTKGGTGDLLAGVCASLIAQGINSFDAAYVSASVLKRAGVLLGKERGPFYLPSELLPHISKSLLAELGK